jgi:nitrate reductase gamma subunit
MGYDAFPYFPVLVLSLLFDVGVLFVVIAHIRFVASLNAQIMALEASTDMLLQSQRELTKLIVAFLSKTS